MYGLPIVSAVVSTLANQALTKQIVSGFHGSPGRCDNDKVNLTTTEFTTNCANRFCKKRVDGGCGCTRSFEGDPWPGEVTSDFLEFPDRECVEACERNGFAATQQTTYVRESDPKCPVVKTILIEQLPPDGYSIIGNNQQIASFKEDSSKCGQYECSRKKIKRGTGEEIRFCCDLVNGKCPRGPLRTSRKCREL